MLSAVLAILKAIVAFGAIAVLLGFFVKYGVPLITFAVGFVTDFLVLLPAWVAPFVMLSVGLAILALVIRII